MAEPMGLLVAGMNYSPVGAEEYNAWYDTEHVPERLRVKGFVNAERWLGADDPFISIAAYDLDSPAVLKSPAYTAIAGPNLSPWSKRITGKIIRICRLEAEQLVPGRIAAPANAQGMLMVAMNVAPEAEAEFNAWYNEEHVPALGAVPGCLSARRFKTNGGTHKVHRSLSLECARSAGNGGVEKSRGHAVDCQSAAAFSRHAAPRAAALCPSN
jgi:hypothetical protein